MNKEEQQKYEDEQYTKDIRELRMSICVHCGNNIGKCIDKNSGCAHDKNVTNCLICSYHDNPSQIEMSPIERHDEIQGGNSNE